MEKDGEYKMDRQNKKCSCARMSGRRNNNAGTDKKKRGKEIEDVRCKTAHVYRCLKVS